MSPRILKVEAFIVLLLLVFHVTFRTKQNIFQNICMRAEYGLENEQNVKSRSAHILLLSVVSRVEEEGSG